MQSICAYTHKCVFIIEYGFVYNKSGFKQIQHFPFDFKTADKHIALKALGCYN